MIHLHHHPFSRAASVVWMLEEVGVPYELRFVDLKKGAQKLPELLALNPMGKLPILEDGDAIVTETAAIGLYLADRYAPGRLAPALDDPLRAPYLRWTLFSPSVVEPAAAAKGGGWKASEAQVGWGGFEAMQTSLVHALSRGDHVLGERFSMADVVLGGTMGFLLRFGMLEKRPEFVAYTERLAARPARQRADEINARIVAEHGLGS